MQPATLAIRIRTALRTACLPHPAEMRTAMCKCMRTSQSVDLCNFEQSRSVCVAMRGAFGQAMYRTVFDADAKPNEMLPVLKSNSALQSILDTG